MIGLEPTFAEHVENLLEVFRECRRVLRDDGVMVVNYGDAYSAKNGAGSTPRSEAMRSKYDAWDKAGKMEQRFCGMEGIGPKNLMMMPSRVAIALQEDGWILRSMMPWIKKNPMPESCTDRPTNAVEYLFLLTKKPRYYWDADAVRTERDPASVARDYRGRNLLTNPEAPQSHKSLSRPERQKTRRKGKSVPAGWASNEAYKGQDARHAKRDNPTYKKQDALGDPRYTGFNERYKKKLEAANKKEKNPERKKRFPTEEVSGFRDREYWDSEEAKQAGANMRNYLIEATQPFKDAHFATFPTSIVEPWVKAGTSEHGCCPDCGAPWAREPGTICWNPTCDCYSFVDLREDGDGSVFYTGHWENKGGGDAKVVPCTVLDPFGGSGTVAVVADRLQRDAIIIEISEEYAEIARKRIYNDAPLLAEMEG